jgi:hypothetical protein
MIITDKYLYLILKYLNIYLDFIAKHIIIDKE